jgi:Zn-dependent metalloprotease
MTRTTLRLSLLALSVGMAFTAHAQTSLRGQSEAAARLSAQTGNTAEISYNAATGAARFVRVNRGSDAKLMTASKAGVSARGVTTDAALHAGAVQFLKDYSGLFGITDVASELAAPRVDKDRQGGTHLSYRQMYRGVPVFGGELKAHYDATNNLTVANGTFVPNIAVSATPSVPADDAARIATKRVIGDLGKSVKLSTKSTLMIYREGLAQGVPGDSHLAWEVVVGNGVNVRDFVYVDAHSGQVIEKVSGIHDGKNRRAYDGHGVNPAPGPDYPNSPFWVEGQAFPTGNTEADNMIAASSEIYDLFKTAFGRDSYNGAGATMDSIFNRGDGCPNASWNGTFISFCPGTTTDDVTAHEWGHAYTEYTHGLVYHWQPGALNEAYSDIWGETVDRINGRGGDTPDAVRSNGSCTTATALPPTVQVTAPASLAGMKDAGTAAWGPATFTLSGSVAGVQVGSTSAACTALPAGSLTGKIAFVERGTCGFSVKAMNAQAAGAIGVIIGNNQGATAVINMSETAGSTSTLPSLSITQNDGTAFKTALAAGAVNVTISRGGKGSDASVRWLIGEDSSAFGGAIRDMYTPTCYGNPGKVTDKQYSCGPDTQLGDWGGVHNNSGIPNHGYALVVDGGTYNGQSITGIGLTKAAHMYYRAQSVYQGSTSGFADHADALEQSCRDLTGVNLANLKTGAASGEIITVSDCAQVTKMIQAVEFRVTPSQCSFTPLLAKNPPALCATGTATSLLSDNFDGGRRASVKWAMTHAGVASEFTARDWGVAGNLPGQRTGYAMFAADINGGTCAPGGDQSGLQRLESPEITVPAGASPRLTFDHYVATEASYDGGNVKISVNGGTWTLVKAADFIYNPYNTTLATVAGGNTNPLAGQAAFSGSDSGSVVGSWGRSIVNLAPYAVPGDKVKIRFELGNDGCGGTIGWYLDDVMVYRCTP